MRVLESTLLLQELRAAGSRRFSGRGGENQRGGVIVDPPAFLAETRPHLLSGFLKQ